MLNCIAVDDEKLVLDLLVDDIEFILTNVFLLHVGAWHRSMHNGCCGYRHGDTTIIIHK